MGKTANARRRKLFEELKENGKLDPPPKKQPHARKARAKAAVEAAKLEAEAACCELKFKGNLPETWRRCSDCRLDSQPAV